MSIFSKLFKRNNVNTEALGLINLNSFIVYPDKSFYEEEENKRVYREFTDRYKEVLSTHKTITSKDLNLNEEINVKLYTEIINKLLLELDYTLDPINNSPERNSVNIKILYLKLRHYQYEINNYKNEVFIKLKVLNELHKKYIFSKNKREAIKSEITNLEMNIVMCQNNFNALNMEINSYSSIINYSELKEVDEEEYLSKRSKKLERFMNAFGLTYKSNDSISSLIANELVLEKYLFTNNFNLESEFESVRNKEEKLNFINTIIDKYMAMHRFAGKEDKKFIKSVFDSKYKLIKYRYITNPVLFEDAAFYDDELSYYENCIQSEIQAFIKDKDKKFFNAYSKEFVNFRIKEYARMVRLVKELISDSNQNIWQKSITMGIIFSLNNPKSIREFFKKFGVAKYHFEDEGVVFYEELYDWLGHIPLESVMQVYKNGSSNNDFIQNLSLLYNLLYVECSEKEVKRIYEGVTNIKSFYREDFKGKTDASKNDYIREILDKLNYDGKRCKLYIPSTIDGWICLTEFYKAYMQNDNCGQLYLTIYSDYNLRELSIANTDNPFKKMILNINVRQPIEEISLRFYNDSVQTITFDNILNEKMLNEKYFYELLKDLFYRDSQGYCSCRTDRIVFKINNFYLCVSMDYSVTELLFDFPDIYDKDFEVYRRKLIKKILDEVYKVTQQPRYRSDVESRFVNSAEIKQLHLCQYGVSTY